MTDATQPTTSAAAPDKPISGQAQQPQGQPYPSVEVMLQMMPDADKQNLATYMPGVFKAMASAGMVSPNEIISVLATIYAETYPFMKPIEEKGATGNYGYLPNGKSAHGRGYIQTTGPAGYKHLQEASGIPAMDNPDILFDPEVSAKVLVWHFTGAANTPNWTKLGPAAKSGDFPNVRSIVNRGHPNKIHQTTQSGTRRFLEVANRGKSVITQPLDPNALGALTVPGNTGLQCADGGSGLSQTATMGVGDQGSALMHALSLLARDRAETHRGKIVIDVAEFPQILDLDAQLTFDLEGLEEALNGTYTCRDIEFIIDDRFEALIYAHRPDPNAATPEVFLHNTNAPLTDQPATQFAGPAAAGGDLNARLAATAKSNIGKESRSSGAVCEFGNLACAWATNKYCVVPVTNDELGDNPLRVISCIEDMESGRGQEVKPRTGMIPGDIVTMNGRHIGVCIGPSEVLSNSSGAAAFKWIATLEEYDRYYRGACRVWRLLR